MVRISIATPAGPYGAAGDQSERHRSAFVDSGEVTCDGDDQHQRREREDEAQLERVIAGGHAERAFVVVHDAEANGGRHVGLEGADPEHRHLLRHEIADREERRDADERKER